MQFRLRMLLLCVFLVAFGVMLASSWLRRPVTGRTLSGESFQLKGQSALIHCVMTNDAESLNRLLLMDNYDLDAVLLSGEWTLLQHALHHGCAGTSELLLQYGADPNAASDGTPSLLELARRSGKPSLVIMLKRFGAKDSSL